MSVSDEEATMYELGEAADIVANTVGKDASTNIIVGLLVNTKMKGQKKVTVLASGIKDVIWKKLLDAKTV
jgi:cell division GTPase FtsZ